MRSTRQLHMCVCCSPAGRVHCADRVGALPLRTRRRKKEHDLQKVEADFRLKLRLDKVDCIQKTSLYRCAPVLTH